MMIVIHQVNNVAKSLVLNSELVTPPFMHLARPKDVRVPILQGRNLAFLEHLKRRRIVSFQVLQLCSIFNYVVERLLPAYTLDHLTHFITAVVLEVHAQRAKMLREAVVIHGTREKGGIVVRLVSRRRSRAARVKEASANAVSKAVKSAFFLGHVA